MILVKSKTQGFVGLLVGATGMPVAPKIASPGAPQITMEWVGIVLVDKTFVVVSLPDLEPILPEEEDSPNEK